MDLDAASHNFLPEVFAMKSCHAVILTTFKTMKPRVAMLFYASITRV